MSETDPSGKIPGQPRAGAFTETAQWVRLKVERGEMTREEALRLSNEAYHAQALSELNGYFPQQDEVPGEWPIPQPQST